MGSVKAAVVLATAIQFLIFIVSTHCDIQLNVVPERGTTTYLNEKHIIFANFTIKRYGRKSGYYVNVIFVNRYPWHNNVTISLVFFERLGTEYKRSFLEYKFKMCDLFEAGAIPYFGKITQRSGVTCPLSPGYHYFTNMTAKDIYFPYIFPYERCRADYTAYQNETGEILATAELFLRFEQKYVKNTKAKKT